MAVITVLDDKTIDQIAAGEVVERPASVVKELVENAMDAGATAITVEIRDGGSSFIRVTDNGGGIEKEQVKKAFYRHATSKISSIEDLYQVQSLGFRGEALSSIAAVSMVELITKTKDALTGIRYCIEGEREREFSEIGAPDGTTIIIRDLFFNTPARRKFLKTPATEGSHIADLMEHLALSRPDISFQFIQNKQPKFHTSGNGDLREIVYRIYGRQLAKEIFPVEITAPAISIRGYLGNPAVVRANRNFEFFFVNGRYIRSQLLSKALESGYRSYLMQHRFPFALLHFTIDTEQIDVNVHPSKMEIRFHDSQEIYDFVEDRIRQIMRQREMIPEVTLDVPEKTESVQKTASASSRTAGISAPVSSRTAGVPASASSKSAGALTPAASAAGTGGKPAEEKQAKLEQQAETKTAAAGGKPAAGRPPLLPQPFEQKRLCGVLREESAEYRVRQEELPSEGGQMSLFEEKLLSPSAVEQYRIIGQVFDTYWIAVYQDKMIYIDQHAAHEKVKYEALIRRVREGQADSQLMVPPEIITLTAGEVRLLEQYRDYFTKMGFELEEFGGNSYALRAVPCDLYGQCGGSFLQSVLAQMEQEHLPSTPAVVEEKLASMACKSAVKGNHRMSQTEMQELLNQLLTLDNPYHCPHGRPTMITMSKYELEKKFKRIV